MRDGFRNARIMAPRMIPEGAPFTSTEQHKERARNAQRRFRARQSARQAHLSERVGKTTKAVDDTVEACLKLTEAVAVVSRLEDLKSLREKARSTTSKLVEVLKIVHTESESADLGDETDNGPLTTEPSRSTSRLSKDFQCRSRASNQMPDTMIKLAGSASTSFSNDLRETSDRFTAGCLSPFLDFALWPQKWLHTPTNKAFPPLDCRPYLEGDTISFSVALYWSASSLGAYAAKQHAWNLISTLFYWVISLEGTNEILEKMQRRLMFRPKTITPRFYLDIQQLEAPQDENDELRSRELLDLEDVQNEAAQVEGTGKLVTQAMMLQQLTRSDYTNSIGVQRRLELLWGIPTFAFPTESDFFGGCDARHYDMMETGRVDESGVLNEYQSLHQSLAGEGLRRQESLVKSLAAHATCLGDEICFPVKAVDEVALRFLHSIAPSQSCI